MAWGHCDTHNQEWEWVEVAPGRKKLCCRACHDGVKTKGQVAREFPLIRFGQQWHRDRALTEADKRRPPKKPT